MLSPSMFHNAFICGVHNSFCDGEVETVAILDGNDKWFLIQSHWPKPFPNASTWVLPRVRCWVRYKKIQLICIRHILCVTISWISLSTFSYYWSENTLEGWCTLKLLYLSVITLTLSYVFACGSFRTVPRLDLWLLVQIFDMGTFILNLSC